jgi:hypothetical protein
VVHTWPEGHALVALSDEQGVAVTVLPMVQRPASWSLVGHVVASSVEAVADGQPLAHCGCGTAVSD